MSDFDATVTLTLDNDEVIECGILTIFTAGEHDYIALLPLADFDSEDEESEVYLYRYSETEDGQPELSNIEDDDEYEVAADAYDEWLDEQDFEEFEEDEE